MACWLDIRGCLNSVPISWQKGGTELKQYFLFSQSEWPLPLLPRCRVMTAASPPAVICCSSLPHSESSFSVSDPRRLTPNSSWLKNWELNVSIFKIISPIYVDKSYSLKVTRFSTAASPGKSMDGWKEATTAKIQLLPFIFCLNGRKTIDTF